MNVRKRSRSRSTRYTSFEVYARRFNKYMYLYTLKKFNLFHQFYDQTSIFILKVCFLPNADILDYWTTGTIIFKKHKKRKFEFNPSQSDYKSQPDPISIQNGLRSLNRNPFWIEIRKSRTRSKIFDRNPTL